MRPGKAILIYWGVFWQTWTPRPIRAVISNFLGQLKVWKIYFYKDNVLVDDSCIKL